MKNVSRTKFLLCFKPVGDMELVLEPNKGGVHRSQNRALSNIAIENRKEDMKVSLIKSSVSDDGFSRNSENNSMIQRPRKRKTFSRVIKAVVFETILAKRVRERKGIDQETYRSKFSSASVLMNTQKSTDSVDDEIQEIKSDSVFSSTSSLGSSSSSCSSSDPEPKKQQQGQVKPKEGQIKHVFYLLLISLAVTILWGKLCAILFTSIWLYLIPRRQRIDDEFGVEISKRKLPETELIRYYKKRVIMEGLLERNHQHRGSKVLK